MDFGFARFKRSREPLHTPCYTRPYAAPEVLTHRTYDESCDMWSLGVILFTMLSGRPSFSSRSPDLATRIRDAEVDFDSEDMRRKISSQGRLVLKGLLTESSGRLTASALANHAWLARGIGEAGPSTESSSSESQR